MTETQKAREALAALGADLTTIYATLCPPPLVYLALKIDRNVSVLDTLDKAIERKANLDLVCPRWALWLLSDVLKKHPTSAPVAVLLNRKCSGDPPSLGEWGKAEKQAWRLRDDEASPRSAFWVARYFFIAQLVAAFSWAAVEAVEKGSTWDQMAEKLAQLLNEAP